MASSVKWHEIPSGSAVCSSILAICPATLELRESEIIEPARDVTTRKPVLCFLITHESGRKVMFDLSLAEGWQSWLGDKATFFEKEFKVELHDDLVKQLQGAGVKAEEVESIILSHRHFDHTGNPAAFSRAEVVIHASERSATPCLAHHDRVKEISFNSDSKPAGFFEQSFDFFGDGSLLLLEAGGHTEGHLAALVHTSSNEYVLLAADCCHHSLLLSSLSENKHYKLGKAMYDDLPRAADTLEKLRASNARDEILVVLAHNETEWAHEKWSHGKRNAVVELAGWRKRGLKVPGLNDTVS